MALTGYLPTALALLALLLTPTLAAEDSESCIMSSESCQCSVQKASGGCLRSQGDGTCLVGDCNEGYRCDCFGFEVCKLSQCGKYTAADNAIQSSTKPFQCVLKPGAATCTAFDQYLDTTKGADNANAEASTSNDEASNEDEQAADAVSDIRKNRHAVNEAMKKLEEHADKITDEEQADVEREAEKVFVALQQAVEESAMCTKAAEDAYRAKLEASKMRKTAHAKEQEVRMKQKQQEEEAAKPENAKQCETCDALKEEIRKLREERKQAAIAAGTWAKKSREQRKKASARRKRVSEMQMSAEEARARCVAKSEKILSRLRGDDSQKSTATRTSEEGTEKQSKTAPESKETASQPTSSAEKSKKRSYEKSAK